MAKDVRVWTTERNEKLLLLLLHLPNVVNTTGLPKTLAATWLAEYPDEPYKPSKRAIQEQLKTLRNRSGGKAANKATITPVVQTPTSVKKRSGGKIATPSTKRTHTVSKKGKSVDFSGDEGIDIKEEEDSDSDLMEVGPPRQRLSRRSKSAVIKYKVEDEDEDGGEDEAEEEFRVIGDDPIALSPRAAGVGTASSKLPRTPSKNKKSEASSDDELTKIGVPSSIARSKNSKQARYESMVESDESDFNPNAEV